MVNINTAFPSKFLKADDLKNRNWTVTVDRVEMEDVGDHDQKPILYFQGAAKGMVLNRTNAQTIAYIFGEETDGWKGKQVELFVQSVSFQGRMVPAIRCRAITESGNGPLGGSDLPNPAGAQLMSEPAPPATSAPPGPADLDDEIPF